MPQRKQIAWAQLRVGILALVSLIVLGVGIFFISGQVGFFTRHYQLKAYFPSAGGVREGAEVRLAGITVGSVRRIQLSPYADPNRAVEIDMRLTRLYQRDIRSDSVANIETAGLLGDAYIDLTRGGEGQPVLPPNAELKSQQEADIKRVVQNANDVISNLRVLSATLNDVTAQIQRGSGTVHSLLYDRTFYDRLNDATAKIDRLTTRVEAGEGTMGKFMADDTFYRQAIDSISRVDQVLDDIQHGKGSMAKFISDPSVYDQIHKLTTNANTLVDNINNGQGTLGKLVNDHQLYDRLNDTTAHLETITARIDKGEGTFGKLSTDATLYNSLNESAKTLRDFLTEFRKDPRKYLTMRVHIF